MLNLIGKDNCAICEASKHLLDENNVTYNFMNIMEPDSLKIAQRFNVRVAGKFLYDDDKDEVISVSDYIDSLGK